MANTNAKLEIENLTKTFGSEVAVDDLSMSIEEGNLKSLLGPSGCGKTTTLRCVAGLETPDSGRIYIDDELVSAPEDNVHVPPEKRDIGMVFQSYAVWPHMTVEQNVRYPLKVKKIGSKQEREEKVQDVLERVGLAPYAGNLATNLSGGQQQRVAIARALVVEPNILLFDEPLSNLDAKLRRDMRLEIKELYEEFNTTVLYVTHSQDEAMFLSDQIALMLDGSIVEEGDPVGLHTDPQTFFGMNFMGQCNTYTARVDSLRDSIATVDTQIGDLQLRVPEQAFEANSDAFLCFRPKACQILTDGEQWTASGTVIEGTVDTRAATRDFVEYQVLVNDSRLLIRTMDPVPLTDGDPIQFAVNQSDLKLFPSDEGQAVVNADQADVADYQSTEQTPAAR